MVPVKLLRSKVHYQFKHQKLQMNIKINENSKYFHLSM